MRMNLTPRNETFAQTSIIKELKHLLKKKGIVLKRRFSREALSTEVSGHFDIFLSYVFSGRTKAPSGLDLQTCCLHPQQPPHFALQAPGHLPEVLKEEEHEPEGRRRGVDNP